MNKDNILNSNIDLFVDFFYCEENNLCVTILISENNQLVNLGTYSKDTKTNLTRLFNLYSNLSNPMIIAFDFNNKIPMILEECKKHNVEQQDFITDFYYNKNNLFKDLNNSIFFKEYQCSDNELKLFKCFFDWLYFSIVITNEEINDIKYEKYNKLLELLYLKSNDVLADKEFLQEAIEFFPEGFEYEN